eukprot:TRINITY_DN3158_c0_g2_i2.p1 TRINITY_DN3158_c0_g2~~TRINITY_DN3158_c0_g2_i2.p1  ORF type:complete len:128 (-),score=10.71 TRINITY_DN3158_c0_g2_i2:129-512(-)
MARVFAKRGVRVISSLSSSLACLGCEPLLDDVLGLDISNTGRSLGPRRLPCLFTSILECLSSNDVQQVWLSSEKSAAVVDGLLKGHGLMQDARTVPRHVPDDVSTTEIEVESCRCILNLSSVVYATA